MHEIDLALELVDLALQERERHHGLRVVRLEVQVGELSCVAAEALAAAFGEAQRATPLQGAELEIVRVPASGRCRQHGQVRLRPGGGLTCPDCGRVVAEVLSGTELSLEALELAAEEPVREESP